MPNRIVREGIITSEPINALGWPAEVFYRRLLSVVDDYGRYHGNLSLLRAACYPLRLNDVSDQDVGKWLRLCVAGALVRVYRVEGKEYVQVEKFDQQVRAKRSKYPPPDSTCLADAEQMLSTRIASAPVVEVGDGGDLRAGARDVLAHLNAKADREYQPVDANLNLILSRMKEGASVEDCKAVVDRKCEEWLGDAEMSKYLRPATLFAAAKFAQYRGEKSRAVKVDV